MVEDVYMSPDEINLNRNGTMYKKTLFSRGLFRTITLVIDDTNEPEHLVTVFVVDKQQG